MQRQISGSSVGGNQISPSMVSNSRNIPVHQIPVKRTFKGNGTYIWSEYMRYFENISEINGWDNDRKRKVFSTVLRGQAETFCYGLSDTERNNCTLIKESMNMRFGNKAMKESYITEDKLRFKKHGETFRDFGQAIQDLYRRAYPESREYGS